jgi:hypothetical protein
MLLELAIRAIALGVEEAWKLIEADIRKDHPVLNETPLPDAVALMNQARSEALARVAR